MTDDDNVKFALTIFCSVLFLGGQMLSMAMPATCASQPVHHCACGGKMPCCATSPASVPQPPLTATVPVGPQQQILSPVPVMVVWVLPATASTSVFPVVTTSAVTPDAPLFARHCTWLI